MRKFKEKSVFFPPLAYLPFIAVLFYSFLFYMAWKLPFGVVKSKRNMADLAQIIGTVFITPVIYI